MTNWDLIKENASLCYGSIYNFPDQYIFNSDIRSKNRLKIRAELGIKNNEIIIISTGRITVPKGYEVLKNVIAKKMG